MYYVDFILNYPNRCIIGVKNLMTIVWKIRIYYYLRCNISMLRLICDHWFLMLDKCGVYVRVSREVSITAGITFVNNNDRACSLSFFLRLCSTIVHSRVQASNLTPDKSDCRLQNYSVGSFFMWGCGDDIMYIARLLVCAKRYPRELELRSTRRTPPESRAQCAIRKPLF